MNFLLMNNENLIVPHVKKLVQVCLLKVPHRKFVNGCVFCEIPELPSVIVLSNYTIVFLLLLNR